MRHFALIALAALMAAGCAAPRTIRPAVAGSAVAAEQDRQSRYALERRAGDYRRVYDIAERLSRANTELCPRSARVIGARFENLNDYHRDFRDAARSLWGISNQPSVQWVGEGSPAAAAGLRVRDQVLSVNGEAARTGRGASRQLSDLLRDAAQTGDVTLEIVRGGVNSTLTITPRDDCAYQFFMLDDDEINAFADGASIVVNRGMLRFVENDEELALILGHELAHNTMRHLASARQNAMIGAVGGAMLDILAAAGGVNTGGAFSDAGGDIGRMMFTQEFEAEADYVGMYFMARAGYPIVGVEEFWRRMAVESPREIRLAYTHPTTAERFLHLSYAGEEIGAKIARGEALRPNMGGERAEPASAAPEPSAAPASQAPQEGQPAREDAVAAAPSPS